MASSVRKAERIVGATNASGELYYLMKWEDIESPDLVSAKEVDIMYPQIVINFYQEKVSENTAAVPSEVNRRTQKEIKSGKSDQKSTMNKNYEDIICVYNCGGELTYLMKFEGMDVVECVSAQEANLMCPQMVIKFYQEKVPENTAAVPSEVNRRTQKEIKSGKSDQTSTVNNNYEKITGVNNCGGKLIYFMKFEGMDVVKCVPAQEANLMCPQMVIKFHEEESHGPVQINSGDENDE